jgi:creatinine amidohydrolase/Fe(II)-dependent formamide hydrolase-like protein
MKLPQILGFWITTGIALSAQHTGQIRVSTEEKEIRRVQDSLNRGHEVGGDLRLTRIFAKPNGRWVMVGAQDTKVNPQRDFRTFTSNAGHTLIRGRRIAFESLNTRQIEKLDRAKTVVIVPGGILEEHGPYLPAGSDGVFNNRLAHDLATFVAKRPGWNALMLPSIALGAGAANEIGAKYSFPGSCTVLPATLRAVYMDLADQLGKQGFQWILVVSGHGDPAHNSMIDQAADYFHDTYHGEMVNVFGYVWAMKLPDLRTKQEQQKDGLPEHATMTETSVVLALKPEWVSPDYKKAIPQSGNSIEALEEIAKRKDWPGYFGDPARATRSLGTRIYQQWLTKSQELVSTILAGADYREMPRYGDIYAGDPADAAASRVNAELQARHEAWISQRIERTKAR